MSPTAEPIRAVDEDEEARLSEIRKISAMVYDNRPNDEIALAVDRSRDFIIAYVKKWHLPSGRERLRARRAEKRARAAAAPTVEKAPAVKAPSVESPPVESPSAVHDVIVTAAPANDIAPAAPANDIAPAAPANDIAPAAPANDIAPAAKSPRPPARPRVNVRPSLAPAADQSPTALKCRCGRLATRGGAACRQCTPSSRVRDGWKAAGREFAMPPSRAARLAREAEASKAVRDAERARLLRELSPERIVRIAAPAYDAIALVSTNDVIDNVNEIGSMNGHNDEM